MGKFRVGDKVRVREWNDMLKEFGGNDRTISCACIFVDYMKPLCGKVFTVTEVKAGYSYRLDGEARCWEFSDDMLYPAISYREYMKKHFPDCVGPEFVAGVLGCPRDKGLRDFSSIGQCGNNCKKCVKCWDQYMTEAEYKKYVLKEEGEKEMFKVGDIVRVAKKGSSATVTWVPTMDEYIGKYGVVESERLNSCEIKGFGGWNFPYENLEPATLKDLLTPFCTVKARNGRVYLFDGGDRFVREGRFMDVDDYDKNLIFPSDSDFDVMDVCTPSGCVTELLEFLTKRGKCIWKRKEVVEITAEEAAKKLSEQYPGQTVKIIC